MLLLALWDAFNFFFFFFDMCTLLYLFTFFRLGWVFVATCRLSLVAESRGYSLVAVHGLLTAASSLVKDRL